MSNYSGSILESYGEQIDGNHAEIVLQSNSSKTKVVKLNTVNIQITCDATAASRQPHLRVVDKLGHDVGYIKAEVVTASLTGIYTFSETFTGYIEKNYGFCYGLPAPVLRFGDSLKCLVVSGVVGDKWKYNVKSTLIQVTSNV